MKRPREPLYLARRNYRGRRAMDMSRLLPFLGLFLMMLVLFTRETGGQPRLVEQVVYIFVVWFVLIAAAFLLAARLRRHQDETQDQTRAEASDDRL